MCRYRRQPTWTIDLREYCLMKPDAAAILNVEQIQDILGGEDLQRVVARLQRRLAQGKPLTGKLEFNQASGKERTALDRLLGRVPANRSSLTIDLDRLTNLLMHAQPRAAL